MNRTIPPFHLAFPVDDLDAAADFYGRTLGCRIGRTDAKWIDFDFFGHQITAHLRPDDCTPPGRNGVDGDAVPVRHFGAVLPWKEWEDLAARLKDAGCPFILGPRIRFQGQPGEQGTFFVTDPAGNALEFKSFRDPARLFATA